MLLRPFAIFFCATVAQQSIYAESHEDMTMAKIPHNVVKTSEVRSELSRFAVWFHQDWKLLFPDFFSGYQMYVANLSQDRQAALRAELENFLNQNAGMPEQDLKRAWLALGAQAWQANLDVRSTLKKFCENLKRSP